MAINHELRQLRLARGMTQEQAAERLGVTRQALSSYETGRTRPDLDTLLRLAEVPDGQLLGPHQVGLLLGKKFLNGRHAIEKIPLVPAENGSFEIKSDQFQKHGHAPPV